ncbi:MAG: ABC transporter permease [Saprospiraceae bacterium]|nr:ABC transporter permease [Saprospiraceae bacterium]
MNAKHILVKTNFPRESLIISGLYQVILNAVIRISLLIILLAAIGFKPDWNFFLFALSVISLILAGTIVGMFLFPFAMLYSDISKALPILLQLGMFLSPVAFTASGNGLLSKIMHINPLSVLIDFGRYWMIGQGTASLYSFVTILLVSAGLLFLIWMIYRITLPLITERISS